MSTPDHEAFGTLALDPSIDTDMDPTMRQTRAMSRRGEVVPEELVYSILSPAKSPDDANLLYKVITDGSRTKNSIARSLDSPDIEFDYTHVNGRSIQFSGREHFVVTFDYHRGRHRTKCSCPNWSVGSPCSHVKYALNQWTRVAAYYEHDGVPGAAQIDVRIPEASISLDGELHPVWPDDILQHIDRRRVDEFLHERNRPADFEIEVARVTAELTPHFEATGRFEADFPDPSTRVREHALERTREAIAEACVLNQRWHREFTRIMSSATKAAIRLEEVRRIAERCIAALQASQFVCEISDPRSTQHERQVKRNLEECAHHVHNVYQNLCHEMSEAGMDEDFAEATHTAVSTLIFMVRSVLERSVPIADRGGASLWHEMTLVDVDLSNPLDFWTSVFNTFREIASAGLLLTDSEKSDLRKFHRYARDKLLPRDNVHLPNLLLVLDRIRR